MASKDETHLKYGDTVLLTQTGSMLGSYYTNDAVSNLFMIPLDNSNLPASLSCAKTCGCFRILPLFEYESLEELKEEKKRKKLNWKKILQLENNQKREEKDNKKRLNRYLGRVVRYDHIIQLMHIYSGKILTASPRETSYTEPRNFGCYLDADPSKHSRFKILPAVDGYDPGDPVNHSDFINLYIDPDGFVGTSIQTLNPIQTLFPPLTEVFIGPRGGGFSVKLYKEGIYTKTNSDNSFNQNIILSGDLVQFFNKNLNSYLTADDDNNLILKKSPSNDGKHFSSIPNSYWIIEGLKAKYSSPIQISHGSGTAQDVQLINFVTGKTAIFPSGKDHTSLKSLIRIITLDIKSGDCVKLYSGKSWLSFSGTEGDGSYRKIVCTDHRDHTDLFTIHKLDINTRQRYFKLLGFKLLLQVVEERCIANEISSAHLNSIISSIKEMDSYIDSQKKKPEIYENCTSLGITNLCFNICNLLIPLMEKGLNYRRCVEWLAVMVRGFMKHAKGNLDSRGLEVSCKMLQNKSGVGLEAFLNMIKDNVNLIYLTPTEMVEELVEDYTSHGRPIYLKVLRKLCKCKRQAVTSNQNIIIKTLFGSKMLKRFIKFKHEVDAVNVFHLNKWIPLTQISGSANVSTFKELLSQLDLVENMLFGKNSLGKALILEKYGMFSEDECIDVITNEQINVQIRSIYIKILIAAHIDPNISTSAFEPKMLSYKSKRQPQQPSIEQDTYANRDLDKWLLKYVENNTNVITSEENNNQFKHSVILLVEYMFKRENLSVNSAYLERYIRALVKWLDGRLDMSYADEEHDLESREVFRSIFRFRNLPENRKCNVIKQRVLETLHLAFWHCLIHFWECTMSPLYAVLNEQSNNSSNDNKLDAAHLKQSLSEAVSSVVPIMSLQDAVIDVIRNGYDEESNHRRVFLDFLEDVLSEIYIFSETPDITVVLLDILNYESHSLTTRATELMVLLFSPIHRLLGILPKTQIMITEETYCNRKEITHNYLNVLRLTSDPLTEALMTTVIESVKKLRGSCLTEDSNINKAMQKFVFDLGTVKEVIRIVLSTRVNVSSSGLPNDADDYMDSKLLELKIECFRLLKVVISGLEEGQDLAMESFKDLLTVADTDNIDNDMELEQAKAYALDEIFTDNTNLSLNVQEDEILALFHLIIESVTGRIDVIDKKAKYSFLYLAILENMIDMEDSTDFLCKHQTYVLRLIREYWNELNGRVVLEDGSMSELNLLNLSPDEGYDSVIIDVGRPQSFHNNKEALLSSPRGWKGLYFTHAISLMACCVVGDAQSTETICKEQYPLSVIFPLLHASKTDIVYFTCLSKFVLNVYIKSSSVLERQQLLGEELTWYINEGVVLVERVIKNLKTCTTTEKVTYLNVLTDLKTQIKLLSSRDDVSMLLKELVCHYDYIFFVLCPIVSNIFTSDRDLIDESFRRENRLDIVLKLCRFARFVSPFIDKMLWNILFDAIQAINSLDRTDLSSFTFSDADNKMFKYNKQLGEYEFVDEPLLFNKEVQDVMDLMLKRTGYRLKEAYTKKIMKEVREKNMNDNFHKLINVFINITEKPKEGKFVKTSEELKALGTTLFTECEEKSLDTMLNFAPFCDEYEDDYETHQPVPQLDKIIQKIENEECSDYTTIRLINVFAVIAEDSNRSKEHLSKEIQDQGPARKHIVKVGNSPAASLLTMALTEGLGSLMASSENDHIQQAVTECLLSLLQIPTTRQRLRQFCNTADEPLFEWCSDNIKAAIEGNTQLSMIQSMRIRAGIDGPISDVGIASSTPTIRLSVQLIGAMCDGQYSDMQNYLRFQDNKLVSHNFLVMLIRLLQNVRSGLLMMDTIKSINSLISANDNGKETAIENDVVEIVNRIIAGNAPATTLDENMEIKANCYALLSTLVEQSNMLSEFYDKIREELDVKTLQTEINSHLECLATEYGEKAQTAAFKGYALLKKISALEKKDYVGKLDEDISQKLKVGSVEVQWKGHLEKVYYPIPKEGHVRNKIKEELKWGIDRKSKFDKQKDFLIWSQEIVEDIAHQRYFLSIPGVNYIMKHDLWWDWLVFLIALVLQLWLLKEWKIITIKRDYSSLDPHEQKCVKEDIEKIDTNESITLPKKSSTMCPSEGFYFTIVCLGAVHLIACLFLALSYFLANYHRIVIKHNPNKRMTIKWHSFYHFYLVLLLICSACGIYTKGMLYCVHLFHIATLFDLLGRVIRGATKHADQLLVCMPFAVIIAYCYAIIYFYMFNDMFDNTKMEYCDSLGQCLLTVLKNSLRPSSGGHNYSWTNRRTFNDLIYRVLIDSSFWILFTIIGLNVVTSLILDGFRQLKAEREKAVKDMETLCTVCGLSKDYLTSNGISWTTHVGREHNIWSYITFFYYLQEHSGRFSAVENEVLQKFKKADPSFLPSGRCISIDTKISIETE